PAASQIILSLSAMQPLYHACDAGFAIGASIIDANIAALRPSHFPEFVAKCGKERLIFCVVLGRRHQHANPARPIYLVWSAVAPWMNANQPRLGSTSLFIDLKMPDSRQGTTISRWGVAALPLSVFVGVVLGAAVGAAVANIGIGVAVGAGFG